MLLGIPGDNTFSNYQEANRTFWRQTVLPLVQRTSAALAEWLGPAYGGTLTLRPDTDGIDALSSERDARWARIDKSTFLTDDEKGRLQTVPYSANDHRPLGIYPTRRGSPSCERVLV